MGIQSRPQNPLTQGIRGFIMQELTNPEVRKYGETFFRIERYLYEIYKVLVCSFGVPPQDQVFNDMLANNQLPPILTDRGLPWVFDYPPVSVATEYDVSAHLGRPASSGFIINSSSSSLKFRFWDPVELRWTDDITLQANEQLFFENIRMSKFRITPTGADSISVKGWLL